MSLSENRLPSMWWLIIIFTTKIGIVRHPSFSDRPPSHISWIYLPMILQINLHFIISLHRSPLSPHAISPWLDHMEGLPFYGSPVVTIGFNTNPWSSMTTGWFLGAPWQNGTSSFSIPFYPHHPMLGVPPPFLPCYGLAGWRTTGSMAMAMAGMAVGSGRGRATGSGRSSSQPMAWSFPQFVALLRLSPGRSSEITGRTVGIYIIYIYISTDNWKCTSK